MRRGQKAPVGACPDCGVLWALNAAGLLRRHRQSWRLERAERRKLCPGSGLAPAKGALAAGKEAGDGTS